MYLEFNLSCLVIWARTEALDFSYVETHFYYHLLFWQCWLSKYEYSIIMIGLASCQLTKMTNQEQHSMGLTRSKNHTITFDDLEDFYDQSYNATRDHVRVFFYVGSGTWCRIVQRDWWNAFCTREHFLTFCHGWLSKYMNPFVRRKK